MTTTTLASRRRATHSRRRQLATLTTYGHSGASVEDIKGELQNALDNSEMPACRVTLEVVE